MLKHTSNPIAALSGAAAEGRGAAAGKQASSSGADPKAQI